MTVLSARDVDVVYPRRGGGPVAALRNVSLSIDQGEFVVAVGASGCGKTTLLKLFAGFLKPTAGSITLGGEPVDGPGGERGVVFQDDALFPWLSVRGNIEFGPKMTGLGAAERRARCGRIIDLVGLTDFADHRIWELSGGMRQRVGMARALANEPSILLMDEPLGALDALTREKMQELLVHLWDRTKRSVFLITHSVEEAIFLATRIVVLSPRPGRITREFHADFSRRLLDGETSRTIKSDPAFIALREQVLSAVLKGAEA
ncbi:taurine ABC transporter ATP-binding protein [Labrys monachus]|uniref:Taurine transport system ATP-binding protein n=1 Tax=Labrys monachus TaxID=217067 RepID=A0ABU0FJ33_9HYPH|nr:ATP-binding cassette domain-containing protein [Labrys monachus]MDQ0394352.1 taurine transport system ATP-binding protein [Labrys monachus]